MVHNTLDSRNQDSHLIQ